MNTSLRGTGRSTKMINNALSRAENDHTSTIFLSHTNSNIVLNILRNKLLKSPHWIIKKKASGFSCFCNKDADRYIERITFIKTTLADFINFMHLRRVGYDLATKGIHSYMWRDKEKYFITADHYEHETCFKIAQFSQPQPSLTGRKT